MGSDHTGDEVWTNAILSTLRGASEKLQVKKLRKMVLLSLQIDDADKATKKKYKNAVQSLEDDGLIKLNAEGMVKLKKSKRKSKDDADGSQKSKKKRSEESVQEESPKIQGEETHDVQRATNKPCKGNPQGVTRLFLGNLPFAVDEDSLSSFLPGTLTHIKWITDKETGKFYGSAFCEIDTPENAAGAVKMAGSQLMGRPIKINFAPARDGDVWPPPKKVVSGGQAGGSGLKAMSAKPENCVKLFIGNLSYDIDDETITKFFANGTTRIVAISRDAVLWSSGIQRHVKKGRRSMERTCSVDLFG